MRVAVIFAAACGGATTYDPVDHLHVGVDARASADELVDHFERRGYQLVRRVDVNGLSAIELRESERRSVLRVLTRRGQQLSIDAPTEDLRRARVGIWPLSLAEVHADGTVLVVFAEDLARERTCLALLSLAPDGRLVETTSRLDISEDACVEQLVVEGGRLRATVVMRYPALSMGTEPRVPRIHLAPTGEGPWQVVPAPEQAERTRRIALAAALHEGDVRAGHRCAVELAALRALGGASSAQQLATFEDALSGFEPTEAQTERIAETRAYIADGWGRGPDGS